MGFIYKLTFKGGKSYIGLTTMSESDEQASLVRDAERYRWLRAQHWSDSKDTLTVTAARNIRLGSDCPFTERLDEAIDAARLGEKR